MRDLAMLTSAPAQAELQQICERRDLDASVVAALVQAVQGQGGRARRRGLNDQFDLILSDETTDRAT